MKEALRAGLGVLDRALAAAALGCRRESPALLAFLFHHIFEDEREAAKGVLDPHQPILLDDFASFLEHLLEHGYRFVRPSQIPDELDAHGRYALVTFDDGYRNTLCVLPVLRRFGVPATFFVSTSHVVEGKGFWWDALYRERRRRGVPAEAILREKLRLLDRPALACEAYVREQFGPRALVPVGETDRPVVCDELRTLAADPLVTLGNHTADHARLTLLGDAEVRSQIRRCQTEVAELTGVVPEVIAYPNGDHDPRVLRIARSENLRLGVTAEPRKNRLPITGGQTMTIGRYCLGGRPSIVAQCRSARSDLQLLTTLRWLRG